MSPSQRATFGAEPPSPPRARAARRARRAPRRAPASVARRARAPTPSASPPPSTSRQRRSRSSAAGAHRSTPRSSRQHRQQGLATRSLVELAAVAPPPGQAPCRGGPRSPIARRSARGELARRRGAAAAARVDEGLVRQPGEPAVEHCRTARRRGPGARPLPPTKPSTQAAPRSASAPVESARLIRAPRSPRRRARPPSSSSRAARPATSPCSAVAAARAGRAPPSTAPRSSSPSSAMARVDDVDPPPELARRPRRRATTPPAGQADADARDQPVDHVRRRAAASVARTSP